MSPDEFIAFVKRVSYKPNWQIEAELFTCLGLQDPNQVRVSFKMEVPDVKSKGRMALVGKGTTLSVVQLADWDEGIARQWLYAQILAMERHESDEWFAIDGVQVEQPHWPEERVKVAR